MTDPNLPKLGHTSADIVASLSRATFGGLPGIGPAVVEIVQNIIPNQRIERIAKFIQLLDERLAHLEQESLHAKLKTPESIDVLEDAFFQAARATSPERIEYIASVVAYGLSEDEFNQRETKRMLWLLEQLNDPEIVILRSKLVMTTRDWEDDQEFLKKHEELLEPDTTTNHSTDAEIDGVAIKDSFRQHLHDLGLIRRRYKKPKRGELPEFEPKTGMMKSSGSDITRLGRMLLRYLDLLPEWYAKQYPRL